MISLNTSQIAPNIATLLMLRGTDLPPLNWAASPNRSAKQNLDSLADDATLFGNVTIKDESMASAVRAMLYLWNGWPTECAMYAQAVDGPERLYLQALCERHLTNIEKSKTYLREMSGHQICEDLAKHAIDVIGVGADPLLSRFKRLLEGIGEWESFAYLDLWESTRVTNPSHATEQSVCSIQCMEYELLFAHCYQKATGVTFTKEEVRRNYQQRRPVRPKRPPTTSQSTQAKTRSEPASKPAAAKPSASTLSVKCPKCACTNTVSVDDRGKNHKCTSCKVLFKIPAKSGGSSSPPASSGGAKSSGGGKIGIACPRCRSTVLVPESSRGKEESCTKCGTRFKVPAKPAKVAAR